MIKPSVARILPIVLYSNPILTDKTKKVLDVTDEIHQLAYNMIYTMKKAHGYGLSANQVKGSQLTDSLAQTYIPSMFVLDKQIFANDAVELDGKTGYLDDDGVAIIINPEIVERSDEKNTSIEGCLSIPKIRIPVSRHNDVTVKFNFISDSNLNDKHTLIIKNNTVLSRVFQHEIDHLGGILITDVIKNNILSDLEKEEIQKTLDKIRKGRVTTKYTSMV